MLKKSINQKGFTLIELLTVITIIGILSTFVLVSTRNIQMKARDVRRIADFHQFQLALFLYSDDNGLYMGEPGSNQFGNSTTANTLVYELEQARYLRPVPNDPQYPTRQYEYWIADDKQGYVLRAVLEKTGDETNRALRNDLDGTIYGTECGSAGDIEGYYCIGS